MRVCSSFVSRSRPARVEVTFHMLVTCWMEIWRTSSVGPAFSVSQSVSLAWSRPNGPVQPRLSLPRRYLLANTWRRPALGLGVFVLLRARKISLLLPQNRLVTLPLAVPVCPLSTSISRLGAYIHLCMPSTEIFESLLYSIFQALLEAGSKSRNMVPAFKDLRVK